MDTLFKKIKILIPRFGQTATRRNYDHTGRIGDPTIIDRFSFDICPNLKTVPPFRLDRRQEIDVAELITNCNNLVKTIAEYCTLPGTNIYRTSGGKSVKKNVAKRYKINKRATKRYKNKNKNINNKK